MLRRKKIAAVILCAVFSFNFINGVRVYAADNSKSQAETSEAATSLENNSSEEGLGQEAASDSGLQDGQYVDVEDGQSDSGNEQAVPASDPEPVPSTPDPLPNPEIWLGMGIPEDNDSAGDSEKPVDDSNVSDVQDAEDSSEESDVVIWGEEKDYKWNNGSCSINRIKFVMQSNDTVAIDDDIDSAINNTLEGDLVLPEQIKVDGKYYTVTRIKGSGFIDTGDLTSITLPKSIILLGSQTFAWGKKLKAIYVADDNPAFKDDEGVLFNKSGTRFIKYPGAREEQSYTVPDCVTSICNNAFDSSKNLTTINIPDCVYYMGASAFANCYNLKDIKIPSSITTLSSNLFGTCDSLESIVIPDNVTKIGKGAFSCCNNLKNVTLGNGVKEIGEDAFFYNRSLASIDMPDSVTDLGRWTFNGCTSLKSVRLSNNLTKLPDEAFEDCSSLESINIPAAMTDFGESTLSCSDGFHTTITKDIFGGCTSLKSIDVDENNPKYLDVDGVVFSKDMTKLIKYPAGKEDVEYIVPDSVATIQSYSFDNSENLQRIVFPDSVTYIQEKAFYKSGLKAMTLPRNIERVDYEAFSMCTKLNSILVDDDMYKAGFWGFAYCSGLGYLWMCPEQYAKCTNIGNPNHINIECSYKDDVMKVKADSAKCFEKCSDGTVKEVPMTLDSDGYYVHNPEKDWEGTKYFYYEAKLKTRTFTSPVVAVKGNGKTADTTENVEEVKWDENNECVIKGIKYRYNQEDYVWAAGVTDDSENITIPSKVTVDGKVYRVSAISVGAFKDCKELKNVTIEPENGSYNMYYINSDAFAGCSSLESVTIPDTVAGIGNGAFEGCNMDNLTFVLNNESTKNVLTASGIVSDNVVVR